MVQNVVELSSAEDFAGCTTNNVIDIHFKGPTILELTAAGPQYYLCSVGLHCENGQKLSINVSSTPHPDVGLAYYIQAPAPAPIPAAAVRAEHGDAFALVASSLCLHLLLHFLV